MPAVHSSFCQRVQRKSSVDVLCTCRWWHRLPCNWCNWFTNASTNRRVANAGTNRWRGYCQQPCVRHNDSASSISCPACGVPFESSHTGVQRHGCYSCDVRPRLPRELSVSRFCLPSQKVAVCHDEGSFAFWVQPESGVGFPRTWCW